jgi:hypothetical protein
MRDSDSSSRFSRVPITLASSLGGTPVAASRPARVCSISCSRALASVRATVARWIE